MIPKSLLVSNSSIEQGFFSPEIIEKANLLQSSLNVKRVMEIYAQLQPVTLSNIDRDGNRIQLWKTDKYGLIGSVLSRKGHLRVIRSDHIINPLSPEERGNDLLRRLDVTNLKRWALIFNSVRIQIIVWPYMIAAGNGDLGQINTYLRKLNSKTLSSAEREKNGEIVKFKTSGVPFDHQKKVAQNIKGVNNHIEALEKKLDSNIPSHERSKINNEIAKSKQLLKYVDNLKIHYSTYRVGANTILRPGQKAEAVWQKHELLHQGFPKGGGGGGPPKGGGSPPPTPGDGQFKEILQKTGLTKSYNSCHPDNPIAEGSGSGEIGGVGCTVELIEGLFDSPESLFESRHSFFIPTFEEDGEAPFTIQEMQQIACEVAKGVFVDGTIPFFSLHFNQEANLYPVIHPAYEHTLVGQVFSMLDYFMKGYLNGGVFRESFLALWHKNPIINVASDSLLNEMINFKSYAQFHLQGNDKHYFSVRELVKKQELKALKKVENVMNDVIQSALNNEYLAENPIFKDFTKFTNSFRIIAKQRGIHKAENMFKIDSDFDVEYTVTPDPDYKKALEEHYNLHGVYPQAYAHLLESYELMKNQIHDHMVKMPFCKKYFAMLGVINFFSYYFMTLKKHHKVPILPEVDLLKAQSPSLFPPLPILSTNMVKLKVNIHNIFKLLLQNHKNFLKKYLLDQASAQEISKVKEYIEKYFWVEVNDNASNPIKRALEEKMEYKKLCAESATETDILMLIKSNFDELEKQTRSMKNRKPTNEIIEVFLKFLPTLSEDKAKTFAKMYLDLFILPSEQTKDELELGKKIVGGCGMVTTPMKVQLSESARTILNRSWATLQENTAECWTSVASDDPEKPLGVVFTLPFMNIPVDYPRDRQSMEEILSPPGEHKFSLVNRVHFSIRSILEGNQEEFIKSIKESDVKKVRDRENRSLLHHSATVADPLYTKELLAMGLSTSLKDHKEYLPIHYAAMSGHLLQLKMLTEQNHQEIHAKSNQGATPLIVAIQNGQYLAVEFLIKNGATGDEQLNDGYTSLHCAVHHGHEEIVRLLLEHSKGALKSINTLTNEGITSLMIACQRRSFSMANYLLEKGADPMLKARNGTTALEISVKKDQIELCRLLTHRSELNATTIELAIRKGSLEINKLLLQRDYLSYTNPLNETPLLMAVRYVNIPVAMLILNEIQDPNQLNVKNRLGDTAIVLAIKGKFYTLLVNLLKRGASIGNKELFERLLHSGYHGQCPALDPWLNGGANDMNHLILIAAKAGNHTAITQLLLPKGGDLSKIEGALGWKIDHFLAKSDGIYLFRMRAQERANLFERLPRDGGRTLPYIAGENGSWRVFEFLIGQLKSIEGAFKNHYLGRHLFYSVLQRGDLEGIRIFLDSAGDLDVVNAVMDDQKTFPVHLAAKYCSLESLQYLHLKGANFAVQDGQGHYPIYYAVQRSDELITRFLLEEGHCCPVTADVLDVSVSLDDGERFDSLLKQCPYTEKNNALFLAIARHATKDCSKLIQKETSVTHRNKNGYTPFLLASQEGNVEILEMIFSKHPEVMHDNVNGNNALHLACKNGHEHCVKFLVEHGFSVHQANSEKKTPTALANQDGAVLYNLGLNPHDKSYENQTKMLQDAVITRSLAKLINSIQNWPVNSYFTINVKGFSFRGTLLHIALTLCGSCDNIHQLVVAFSKREEFKPTLRDSMGNTYAHLMIENSLDPTEFPILDFHEVNSKQQTLLHVAALEDESCLQNLIKQFGPLKLDPIDCEGRTPLFFAIQAKKLKNILLLVKSGANLEHRDHYGLTPLILACQLGNYPIIRSLIDLGADINQRGGVEGLTPLSVSLFSKHEELPLFLLFNGAKLSSLNVQGELIGHLAASRGKIYILRFLAEQGFSLSAINSKGLQPIHQAAIKGKIESLEFLTSEGISLETPIINMDSGEEGGRSFEGATPLLLASMQGTAEAVKWLLEHGADPEKETLSNLNILQSTLSNSSVNSQQIIQLLKEFNLIDHLKQILPAISRAIVQDYVQPLKLLYEMGVPIHSKLDHGLTGLHYACKFGSLQSTQFLLTQGADCKTLSDSGETPLEFAAVNKSPDQFQMMINYTNPNLNQKNDKGEALIHMAVRAGNLSHVIVLIDRGANFDCQDAQGRTPLHIAAENGFKDIAALLVLCGADLLAKTFFSSLKPEQFANPEMESLISRLKILKMEAPEGSTPLHIAARAGHSLSVRLLARHFDSNASNQLNRTPLHEAVIGGSLEIIRELLEQGANPDHKDRQNLTPLEISRTLAPNATIEKFLLNAS